MNDFIVNNIVLIVKQDMIRQVISDMVPDMVRSIVREEVTSVREEVTILRAKVPIVWEAVISLREEVPILREAVTSLREEVRSELQSFYERISILIERSSARPSLDPPPPPEAGKKLDPAFGPSSPPPSHFPHPPQLKKETYVAATGPSDDITHAAVNTPTDMVYFF